MRATTLLAHASILIGAALAACDAGPVSGPDPGVGLSAGPLESGESTDGASRTWNVPATAATRTSLGVTRWYVELRSNGTLVFNGLRPNGTIKYWQAYYTSGSSNNPWWIYETESTFLAVRNDGSESYVDPVDDTWSWQFAETVRQAFEHDFTVYFDRVIVVAGPAGPVEALDGESAGTDGGDCQSAGYQAEYKRVLFESSIAAQRSYCAAANQTGDIETTLDCVREGNKVHQYAMDYADALTAQRDTCADSASSTPPSGYIPPPPPPPGGMGGGCGCGNSGQSWNDDDTSSSEWYFNSWKLRCMTTSVTVCTPECTTWYETECWWEQQ